MVFHPVRRWGALLAAFWAGGLVTVAAVATPAPFALLSTADAGRVVARVLAQEAHASLAIGAVLLVLERMATRRGEAPGQGRGSQFGAGMVLVLGALFCTVLGYFAVQPLMPAARAGQGALSFAQLHLVSAVCYGIKTLLVVALAWRHSRPVAPGSAQPQTTVSRASS